MKTSSSIALTALFQSLGSFGSKVKLFFDVCRLCLQLKTRTTHLLVMPLSSFYVSFRQWYSICYFVRLCRRFEATAKNRTKILFVPFEIFLKDIKSFHGTTYTSILDFCWCLPWIWTCKTSVDSLTLSLHDGLLRVTFCATPACLLVTSRMTELLTHLPFWEILSDNGHSYKEGLYTVRSKLGHRNMTRIKITFIPT